MKKMEKELSTKGYATLLSISKKGINPDKEADFSEVLSEIRKILE
jgi:hypothetical protein